MFIISSILTVAVGSGSCSNDGISSNARDIAVVELSEIFDYLIVKRTFVK